METKTSPGFRESAETHLTFTRRFRGAPEVVAESLHQRGKCSYMELENQKNETCVSPFIVLAGPKADERIIQLLH